MATARTCNDLLSPIIILHSSQTRHPRSLLSTLSLAQSTTQSTNPATPLPNFINALNLQRLTTHQIKYISLTPTQTTSEINTSTIAPSTPSGLNPVLNQASIPAPTSTTSPNPREFESGVYHMHSYRLLWIRAGGKMRFLFELREVVARLYRREQSLSHSNVFSKCPPIISYTNPNPTFYSAFSFITQIQSRILSFKDIPTNFKAFQILRQPPRSASSLS